MDAWAEPPEAPPETLVRDEALARVREEMRAPLLALEALLDHLAGGSPAPDVTERMQRDSRVLARRVALLLEDLGLVATPVDQGPALSMRVLDLDHQLAECAASFPDLVIRVVGEPGLRVLGDPVRVQQILANLVRNTQRPGGRSGARSVTLRVRGRRDVVTVLVSDAGPRDAYELSIARRLVEAHRGVAIHEVGGSFAFTLPRASARSVLG
jgi:signal transduction histidine kinase